MARTTKKVVVSTKEDSLTSYVEGQPVNDPAEAAAESGDYQGENVDSLQAEIAALKAQLAEANVKSPRIAKPKLTDEEKEAARVARESEIAQKRAEAMIELADKAKRIQSELLAALSEPKSLEELETLLKEFLPQVKSAYAKRSGNRVASTGDITGANGHTFKPYDEWKEPHHLSNEEVLEIVAMAAEQEKSGKLNKAEIGREFNAHSAMINAILTGKLKSKVTGIQPVEKGEK